MSISGLASATRTDTIDREVYDHGISLVDATRQSVDSPRPPDQGEAADGTQEPLTRKLTRDKLRGELARRKYAKWQTGRVGETKIASSDGADDSADEEPSGPAQLEIIKERGRLKRLGDRVPFKSSKQPPRSSRKQDTVIDILYENQRGSFFCGIPLYSSASLLQIDPAGWQTARFEDSPVNITNAQVPDPSWMWSWKTWYVDMSHDVDDEGWEYSFAFGTRFSWHGSHPWFHSFVRRRRWLRKRMRIKPIRSEVQGGPQASHTLNPDYFTIHVGRDESPESGAEATTNAPTAALAASAVDASDDEDGDIHNVTTLLKAMKRAKVDRQKIALLTNFLDSGDEELYYLADNMSEVMSLLVYQTSRNQLRSKLHDKLKQIKEQIRDSPENSDSSLHRMKENVGRAYHASNIDDESVDGLGDHRAHGLAVQRKPSKIDTSQHGINIADDIKGIPESAGLSEDGIRWGEGPASPRSITSSKGKGKV